MGFRIRISAFIMCDDTTADGRYGCTTYSEEYRCEDATKYSHDEFSAKAARYFRRQGWKVGKVNKCPQCNAMRKLGLSPFDMLHVQKYSNMTDAEELQRRTEILRKRKSKVRKR